MRLELISLVISAFRNFDKNQKITFPLSKVTAIVGKNEDDGGSNGTGKSSLSLAPLVNLFGPKLAGLSIKNLENRYLDSHSQLIGTYTVDGKELTVDRILGGKLSFVFDGTPNKDGKTEDVQEQLNLILKLTSEQLSVLSSKAQGSYGGFLLMKDSDKKEFLSSFFDVGFIEKAKDDADRELSTKEKALAAAVGKIQYINSSIKSSEETKQIAADALATVDTDTYRSEIQGLKDQVTALETNKDAMDMIVNKPADEFRTYAMMMDDVKKVQEESMKKVADLMDKLTAFKIQTGENNAKVLVLEEKIKSIPEVPVELVNQNTQMDAVIAVQSKRMREAESAANSLKFTTMQLTAAKEELTKADDAKCSSCGSPLNAEKIAERKSKVEANIHQLNLSVVAFQKEIDEKHVPAAEIQQAAVFKQDIVQKIATFKAENSAEASRKELEGVKSVLQSISFSSMTLASSLKAEENVVNAAISRVRDQINAHITKLSLDVANIKASITKKEAEVETRRTMLNRITEDLDKLKASVASVEAEQATMRDEVDVLSRITQITSKTGFIGYIFDGMLEDLNSEVNENLKLIPISRKFSLQFLSDKIAKTTGALSKAIVYELYNGTEIVDFETLSGGEKLSVILSVDEALDSVLSKRLGVSVGWKFLDEQFSWIDENSKEAILDYYRTKSADRAYFIVDHASEFNAAFDEKILIIRTNNLAKFAS